MQIVHLSNFYPFWMAPSSLSVKCASFLNQIVWDHLSEGRKPSLHASNQRTALKRVEIRDAHHPGPSQLGPSGRMLPDAQRFRHPKEVAGDLMTCLKNVQLIMHCFEIVGGASFLGRCIRDETFKASLHRLCSGQLPGIKKAEGQLPWNSEASRKLRKLKPRNLQSSQRKSDHPNLSKNG